MFPAASHPLHLLDRFPGAMQRLLEERLGREASATGDDEHLYCGFCHRPVTATRHRLAVAGRFRHHCVNPAGIHFRIGCFSRAPGCAVQGEPTTAHSWFTGYAWQVAVCGHCHGHLGWFFSGNDPSFFGLILAHLLAGQAGPASPA